jgi:hypothetical protein
MSPLTCSHLDEVRTALAQGHWPQACSVDLRTHAETCTRCAQEILLTTHLQQARSETIATAQPVAASLLWWRAQVRRRNVALERAGRPLAAAQIFAFVLTAAIILRVIATHWHTIADQVLSLPAAQPISTMLGEWGLVPLIAAAAVITTLSGVAVYLSTDRH